MDIFMDKLAQRVNAQEIIKANSEADAARMEQLQRQVERYEAGLQDMQNCNAKSAELSEEMKTGLDSMLGKMDESLQKMDDSLRRMGEYVQKMEVDQPQFPNKEELAEMFRQSDDFNHREDVKVYRNVQASIVEENQKQTEQLEQLIKLSTKKTAGRATVALVFAILAFLAAAGTLTLQILEMLSITLF